MSMSQPEALFRLQEIELHILGHQKRLKEIAAALGDNQAVAAAQEAVTSAQTQLKPLQQRARQLDHEMQSNTEKVRTTNDQLYSGRVRNPKELQDMQNEVAALTRRNAELEETLLETMVAVEEAEINLRMAETQLSEAQQSATGEHAHLIEEQRRLQGENRSLLQKREAAIQDVTPDNLKLYNGMRPRKSNQPVALLVNQSCSFCRVEQDLSIISEARKGQKLTYCLSCGRILVYRSG
jgi:hypothetical protein